MKHLTVLLAFVLSLLSGPAHSQEMFAGFDAFCGLPVVVGPDAQTATARTDALGRKFIHIDPGAMANWTMSRMFTLAHECAHHKLGHTSPLGAQERYMGGTARQELEADCWAARALTDAGYTSEITRTMLQNASSGHFASGGYPSGIARANNIMECSTGSNFPSRKTCRIEKVPEPYTDYQTVMVPQTIPCQHCGCGPYGCRCMHSADVVQVPVTRPVTLTRFVERTVCD